MTKLGFCGREQKADKEIQKRIIAAYYQVLVSCSRNREHVAIYGVPSFGVEVICNDLHGMYCGALDDCDAFHDLIIEVFTRYEANLDMPLGEARVIMNEVEKELVS